MTEKPTILLVEDDLDLAEMLNSYFRSQGYGVLTAMWGKDALRICRDTPPDIVMLDIRLPDIDGYEVCRQLRTHRRTENIPVIFLTEKNDRVDKLLGLELGVVDYVTKPFDIQELRLRTRNALHRSKMATMINPATGLPDGNLVKEQLQHMLATQTNWAVVGVSVQHLSVFRDQYGFVAADDLLRAVAVMVSEAINDNPLADFVGHLTTDALVLTSDTTRQAELLAALEARLAPSMAYFYPLKDRAKAEDKDGLRLKWVSVSANQVDATITDLLGHLRAALL